MEEEPNENELEEQFYSMLHYVDNTQANVNTDQNAGDLLENAPRSTARRYWRPQGERQPLNTPYQKVNIASEAPKSTHNIKKTTTDEAKPKEEKCSSPVEPPEHPSLFQSPAPAPNKKIVEIVDTEENVVELETSDEDEVIEVALPPKPTITIESSDDELTIQNTPTKAKSVQGKRNGDRDVSASPVPSIVSSVSDEFIRGDCIALNISSRRPDNQSFDFSLHGSDILGATPAKRKKKKKKKGNGTSTPVNIDFSQTKSPVFDEYFATPKSKAKNSNKKTKSYAVTEKSIPSVDVYDSDSNQSIIELNKKNSSYAVTEKSLPCADVYETDSNPPETGKIVEKSIPAQNNDITSDSSISSEKAEEVVEIASDITESVTIDLTDNSGLYDNDDISESIVMGNVTGLTQPNYEDEPIQDEHTLDINKFGSTKVPAILYENLDFDNLKGKEKVCKNRRYSLTTLRAEMEKFYNESWGGEDFNHREIQKNMSRDKSLWAIDPKDRMTSFSRKKYSVICNYCNRTGHRDDACRLKPLVCYMCGNTGHVEPRCPSKICVNCGSPNYMYSSQCRQCAGWRGVRCAECGQRGHPASHCPDLWRRYHNTIELTDQLEQNRAIKQRQQLYCSGCTRRGHLIHTCRLTIPFSSLPINSPFVFMYRSLYSPVPRRSDQQDSTISSATTPKIDSYKRQSKSPAHETHISKKRHVSTSEIPERTNKSPVPQERKLSLSKEPPEIIEKVAQIPTAAVPETVEKAPDYIPIFSNNHDKKGHVIQDNEVSDTSDVVTSATICITNEIVDKLKTKDGQNWLKETAEKLHLTVENADISSFLSIKGKVADQESFQAALRDWARDKPQIEETTVIGTDTSESDKSLLYNIPKNRNNVLRQISKALESLNEDLGDPVELYRKWSFFCNHHGKLLNRNVVNTKQLDSSRVHINDTLKKLNMVLLGQAGLAGGSDHLKKLHEIQDKLINFRQKNISVTMRKEIGEHYHSIFTITPRNDYEELIGQYNVKRNGVKRRKKHLMRMQPNPFSVIPVTNQQKMPNSAGKTGKKRAKKFKMDVKEPYALTNKLYVAQRKIMMFQKRLLKCQPQDMVLKKTKSELVKKSKSLIGSLNNSMMDTEGKVQKASKRQLKRFREQANLFLKNV